MVTARTTRPLRRWWVTLLLVIAATLTVAISAAAILCKCYWGYVLSPPGVDSRVLGATKLIAHGGAFFFTPGSTYPPNPLPEMRAYVDFDRFVRARNTDNAWRLLPQSLNAKAWRDDWARRRVASEDGTPLISARRTAELQELIVSTAHLVAGAYGIGFPDNRASAQALELLGPSGEPLLFIALRTGELSNDHLAYYELLYDDSVSPPRLLDRRMWYFDIAGYEGAEFASVALGFSILSQSVVVPLTAGVLLYRRWPRASRLRRGLCPSCGYDLRSDFDAGCPECGWGRGEPKPTSMS